MKTFLQNACVGWGTHWLHRDWAAVANCLRIFMEKQAASTLVWSCSRLVASAQETLHRAERREWESWDWTRKITLTSLEQTLHLATDFLPSGTVWAVSCDCDCALWTYTKTQVPGSSVVFHMTICVDRVHILSDFIFHELVLAQLVLKVLVQTLPLWMRQGPNASKHQVRALARIKSLE